MIVQGRSGPRKRIFAFFVESCECGVLYGAAATLITFGAGRLLVVVPPNLRFAAASQLLCLAALGVMAGLLIGVLTVLERSRSSTVAQCARLLAPYSGALSLAAAALAVGWLTGQAGLFWAGAAAIVLTLAIARASSPGSQEGGISPVWLNWTIVPLLIAWPYLAEQRPLREFTGAVPIAASMSATSMILLGSWWIRRMKPKWPWRAQSSLDMRTAVMATVTIAALAVAGSGESGETLQAWSPARQSAIGPVRTSVLLITMDTVRADHMTLYGYPRETTPNLQKFFKEGATLYTRAYSTADWTLPSHASIFTGLMPSEHGAHGGDFGVMTPLPERFETLAEHLRDEGFVTAGIVANAALLVQAFGMSQGFEFYATPRPVRNFVAQIQAKPYFLGELMAARFAVVLGPDYTRVYRRASRITDDALLALSKIKSTNRPFFLFLNYMDAHDPYIAAPAFRRKFGDDEPLSFWQGDYEKLVRAVNVEHHTISPVERQRLEASYDEGLAYADSEIGRLLVGMKTIGLFDNTMVIVTADHGEMFGERGVIGHGTGAIPELSRVPLLIKYPGASVFLTVDSVVSLVDLYPTILHSVEADPEAATDPRRATTSPMTGKPAIVESLGWTPRKPDRGPFDERAVFSQNRMYYLKPGGAFEVIDITHYPALSPVDEKVPSEIRTRLEELAERARRVPSKPASDPGVRERLKALGYLQ